MNTIPKNRRIVKELFRRATFCEWVTDHGRKEVSPFAAQKALFDNDFAKLKDLGKGRFWVDVSPREYFEIKSPI